MPSARFVADENLARLARWLRVAGADTLHRNPAPDDWLLETAEREGRVLLTRDRRLADPARRPPALRAFSPAIQVVEASDFRAQLLAVCRAQGIDPLERAFSRCPVCNAEVEAVPKDSVAGPVPPRSFEAYEDFYRCPPCDRIYWHGDHVERSRTVLESVAAKLRSR